MFYMADLDNKKARKCLANHCHFQDGHRVINMPAKYVVIDYSFSAWLTLTKTWPAKVLPSTIHLQHRHCRDKHGWQMSGHRLFNFFLGQRRQKHGPQMFGHRLFIFTMAAGTINMAGKSLAIDSNFLLGYRRDKHGRETSG